MVHGIPTRLLRPSWPVYWALCPVCEGKPATIIGTCPACEGAGCFLVPPGQPPPTATELLICAGCEGEGKVHNRTCSLCQGAKRHYVRYREEELVEYRTVRDDFGVPVTGRAKACENGYTWLMAQCPVCLVGQPSCPVCLGTSWVPRSIADAIERYICFLPPDVPRDHIASYLQEHLDEIVMLIPHGVPTRRIEEGIRRVV